MRYAARTASGTLLTLVRKLFLALQLFVEANGLILDDRVLNAEPALELVNELTVIGAHLLVDIDAFAVLGDFIGQLARAPVLGLFDLAALFGDGMLDGREDLLDFLFRRCRAGDENQIVQTFFMMTSFLPVPGAGPGKILHCLATGRSPLQRPKNGPGEPGPYKVSSAGGTRRLYLFMAEAIPCVRIISTALPAVATISAATSRSAFFIGRKT